MKRKNAFIKINWPQPRENNNNKKLFQSGEDDNNNDNENKEKENHKEKIRLKEVEQIIEITQKLDKTITQLFIEQFVYSDMFIKYFFQISVNQMKNLNKEYILIPEKKQTNIANYFLNLWSFHKRVWLNSLIEKRDESSFMFNELKNNSLTMATMTKTSLNGKNKFINVNNNNKSNDQEEVKSSNHIDNQLFFNNGSFYNTITNINQTNSKSIILNFDLCNNSKMKSIEFSFHSNNLRKINYYNVISFNLEDFNKKQLGLILTLLNENIDKVKIVEKSSFELNFSFGYFSLENFIITYHVFIMLLSCIRSFVDLLYAYNELNMFLTQDFLFKSNYLIEDPRKKALLMINAALSNIIAKYSNDTKNEEIKIDVLYILQNNIMNRCSQNCFCCKTYIHNLWMK